MASVELSATVKEYIYFSQNKSVTFGGFTIGLSTTNLTVEKHRQI